MNVYDFDKTLYHHNSTFDFYLFELKKHPSIACYWPKLLVAAIKYKCKKTEITEMKKALYLFLKNIDNIDEDLKEFWDEHMKYIHEWYLKRHRDDDLVISGSPYFLLVEPCRRLGISNLIASDVDPISGEVLGANCSREQKVVYMQEKGYDPNSIEEFYSDSYDDVFLARYAQKAYRIINGKITDWDKF